MQQGHDTADEADEKSMEVDNSYNASTKVGMANQGLTTIVPVASCQSVPLTTHHSIPVGLHHSVPLGTQHTVILGPHLSVPLTSHHYSQLYTHPTAPFSAHHSISLSTQQSIPQATHYSVPLATQRSIPLPVHPPVSLPTNNSLTHGMHHSMLNTSGTCASAAANMVNIQTQRMVSTAAVCNASDMKPHAVMYQNVCNGAHSGKGPNVPNFIAQQHTQHQPYLRTPQYQVVPGLPLNWSAGDKQKVMPQDLDQRFRMVQFPRLDQRGTVIPSQGSILNSQFSNVPPVLGVRLHHPTTTYPLIQSHSVPVAVAMPGSADRNQVSFASHVSANHVLDVRKIACVPHMNVSSSSNALHCVPSETGKTSITYGSSMNVSEQEGNQWLAYAANKSTLESHYRLLSQGSQIVQSKPQVAVPHTVDNFLNAPGVCTIASNALLQPRANFNTSSSALSALSSSSSQFWAPISMGVNASKPPGSHEAEHTPSMKPYYYSNMASSTNVSHHQKPQSLPQFGHPRQTHGVDNVLPAAQLSHGSNMLPVSNIDLFGQLSDSMAKGSKQSNHPHGGVKRKHHQLEAPDSFAQQTSDLDHMGYGPMSSTGGSKTNDWKRPKSSSVANSWNQLHAAGHFKHLMGEPPCVPDVSTPAVQVPTSQDISSLKIASTVPNLTGAPNKPPTEDRSDLKYMEWFKAQEGWLHNCISELEGVIAVHKRKKKWLTTKEKTAQKAGRQLSSLDIERLTTATEEHSKYQQQLFIKRKELRAHQAQTNLGENIFDNASKVRSVCTPDDSCSEKLAEVIKRDKPHRRPSSLKLKQKVEEPVNKVDKVELPSSADDSVGVLLSLPPLTLQHPDVIAVPDLLSYQSLSSDEDASNGNYGNMFIKDMPAEYELPATVKKGRESPVSNNKDEATTQDVTATLSVTLTLTTATTDHVSRVLDAIADLLKIAVPPVFEIQSKCGVEEAVKVQSLIAMRPKFCRYCSVVIAKSAISSTKHVQSEDSSKENTISDYEDGDAVFCSVDCRMEFSNAYLRTVKTENSSDVKNVETFEIDDKDVLNCCNGDVKCNSLLTLECRENRLVKQDKKPSPEDTKLVVQPREKAPLVKKWKNSRYKCWCPDLMMSKNVESGEMVIEDRCQFEASLHDTRECILCASIGDGETDGPGRLLSLDVDRWVHLNCALWSYEVFEAQDGTLFNVDKAFRHGMMVECILCRRRGATLNCFEPSCSKVYHLPCAVNDKVSFLADKTVRCCQHSNKLSAGSVMESLAVERLVFVDRDECRQLAKMLRDEDNNGVIRMGSLIIYDIGQLLPHQMQTGHFNSTYYVYPIGFRSVRYYWSFRRLNQRCQYMCHIEDEGGRPSFVVVVTEPGFDDIIIKERSCQDCWRKIFDRVAKLRLQHDVVRLHSLLLFGEEFFGLSDATVIRIVESMPGVELLPNYYCRNVKSSLFTLPLPVNPTGCVRSEPRLRTLYKRGHPLLNSVQRPVSSISTRSTPSTSAVVDFSIAQYMKQFTLSKLQQFRTLKLEWRNNVYLRRSNVQGLGLFAAKELEKHTMVIEYIGQLIRNEVSEMREKVYEQQNRGIYMFRLNDNYVIDATMAGGPARYINHSCSPNCFTEMIPTEKGDKIVIITKRKISTGEELSYDYKFDLEEDKKIPCLCGATNCRKWMN